MHLCNQGTAYMETALPCAQAGMAGMSFHRRAYHAAAEEYGRRNVDRYRRLAFARALLSWLVIGALLMFIIVAAQGGFGG